MEAWNSQYIYDSLYNNVVADEIENHIINLMGPDAYSGIQIIDKYLFSFSIWLTMQNTLVTQDNKMMQNIAPFDCYGV